METKKRLQVLADAFCSMPHDFHAQRLAVLDGLPASVETGGPHGDQSARARFENRVVVSAAMSMFVFVVRDVLSDIVDLIIEFAQTGLSCVEFFR